MVTTDPVVLEQRAVKSYGWCAFCGVQPATGPGGACEHCLELASRFAEGDQAARHELCAMANRNVLVAELEVLSTAYATQDAAYRERLERLAMLSRLHPMGVGRPSKAARRPSSH